MPNLERLLAALAEEVAQGGPGTIPPSLETLDARMADAVRIDAAAAFSGSFAEGAATLKRFAGVSLSTSTFRRHALAAGERAVSAQEFPAL